MSIAYYSQEEENDEDVLVCPECGRPVLISEYGELGLCERCGEEYPISDLPVSSFRTKLLLCAKEEQQ